mmetsp:Transcript_24617/g.55613  ORF Transcript_24617/g.55613 Transcript_24617/m.55613 type:complete len:219 (-) Transcript_24617:1588-2244(-)
MIVPPGNDSDFPSIIFSMICLRLWISTSRPGNISFIFVFSLSASTSASFTDEVLAAATLSWNTGYGSESPFNLSRPLAPIPGTSGGRNSNTLMLSLNLLFSSIQHLLVSGQTRIPRSPPYFSAWDISLAAMLTVFPMIVYSLRMSEPTTQHRASPVVTPILQLIPSPKFLILKKISCAAPTARTGSSECSGMGGMPNPITITSPFSSQRTLLTLPSQR